MPDADPAAARSALRPTEAETLGAWRALYRAAAAQEERLREAPLPGDDWGALADVFAPGPRGYPAPELPLLEALARPGDEWLEVGAGAGRLAIPLARLVRRVAALDRSPGMTARLRVEATAAGLANLDVLPAQGWPPANDEADAAAPVADVALAASVVFFVGEIGPFLDALERHARRLCVVVVMDRMPGTPLGPLWLALHGEPVVPLPALREFLAVLGARGRVFGLRSVRPPPPPALPLREAVAQCRRRYLVAEGSDRERRLRALLAERCLDAEGRVVLPHSFTQTAVVSWAPPPAGA